LLAHRLDTLKSLLANIRHLICKLGVLLLLLILIRLLLLFSNILEKRHLTNFIAVIIDNVAIVVDLKTDAVAEIASGKTTDEIAVLVANFAFFVDVEAGHRVDTAFLLFWLPALSFADGIAVLVDDIAFFVDSVADKSLDVAFDDTANDIASWCLHRTVLLHCRTVESSEGTLLAGILAGGELSTANDVAFVVPDLALTVDLAADHVLNIAFCDAADDLARGVDDITGLVDGAASEG
jgi:hypothetical protein